MDLTKYTNIKKKESEIILINTDEIQITKINEKLKILIKKKKL